MLTDVQFLALLGTLSAVAFCGTFYICMSAGGAQ